ETGRVRQINLLISEATGSTTHKLRVGIYTSSCGGLGGPDTLLGRKRATVPTGVNHTMNVPFFSGDAKINLTVGTRYWVVVDTDDADSSTNGTAAIWWSPMSSVYAIGNIAGGDLESVSIN